MTVRMKKAAIKDDRTSRRRQRTLRNMSRWYCACWRCTGRSTARWSKRELSALAEPIE